MAEEDGVPVIEPIDSARPSVAMTKEAAPDPLLKQKAIVAHPTDQITASDRRRHGEVNVSLRSFWDICVKTLVPRHTLKHLAMYIREHSNSIPESAVDYLERTRSKDDRIQPGTISRMRTMLARMRAGRDPHGKDEPLLPVFPGSDQ
jgi:hypothetical protein